MLRRVSYWAFTGLLAVWLLLGGSFDLTHATGAIAILRTLGYPDYLATFLGICKLLAVPALLYPRAGLLREWAYAGVVFDGLGATYSHLASHDGVGATIAPMVFLVLAGVSYCTKMPADPLQLSTALDSAA